MVFVFFCMVDVKWLIKELGLYVEIRFVVILRVVVSDIGLIRVKGIILVGMLIVCSIGFKIDKKKLSVFEVWKIEMFINMLIK